MPRILITTDAPNRQVVMDELVTPDLIRDDHSSRQIAERLVCGVEDAMRAQAAFQDAVRPRSYREVSAA